MNERGEAISYALSFQDIIDILRTIDAAPGGHELELEVGELKISVAKDRARAGGTSAEP